MIINRITLLAFLAAVFTAPVSAGMAEELCKDWAESEAVDPWDLEDYIRTCAEELASTEISGNELIDGEDMYDEAIGEESIDMDKSSEDSPAEL